MINIRPGTPADSDFIKAHAYRLLEFGPPGWRQDIGQMTLADTAHILHALLSGEDDKAVFIAIDENGHPAGFIHLTIQKDYYTKEQHAHITDIVVIAEAEGTGVGKRLMEFADEWAREKNSRWITLNAFEGNTHARAFYEKSGYQKEWTKYLKQL